MSRFLSLIPTLVMVAAVAACSGGGYGSSSSMTTGPSGPPPPGSFSLTRTAGSFGSLSVSPAPTNGFYVAGTVVTLTAHPVPGYQVGTWNGTDNDASTATTSQVTMNANRTVSVSFVLNGTMSLHADG